MTDPRRKSHDPTVLFHWRIYGSRIDERGYPVDERLGVLCHDVETAIAEAKKKWPTLAVDTVKRDGSIEVVVQPKGTDE